MVSWSDIPFLRMPADLGASAAGAVAGVDIARGKAQSVCVCIKYDCCKCITVVAGSVGSAVMSRISKIDRVCVHRPVK